MHISLRSLLHPLGDFLPDRGFQASFQVVIFHGFLKGLEISQISGRFGRFFWLSHSGQ